MLSDEAMSRLKRRVDEWCASSRDSGVAPSVSSLIGAAAVGSEIVERVPGQPFRRRELEPQNVRIWRTDYALKLAYPTDVAAMIALSNIDLHKLDDLVEAGCPVDLALEIEL
jgi:hypothetical protein